MKLSQSQIKRLKAKYGQWALITGATSGIGLELAYQFAEAGFDLVLTGRRAILLKKISRQLKDQHSIEIQGIPGDLFIQ